MHTTRLITAPTIEPVALAEAKAHMAVSIDLDDAYVTALIAVARHHVETVTRRALITQTVEMTMDYFCGVILLSMPALSVTSIRYTDTAGVDTLLSASNYDVDLYSEIPRITPKYGYFWPATKIELNAVRIRYQSGYGPAAADVPPPIRQAILLMVSHLYEHRESVVQLERGALSELPQGLDRLLWPYRALDYR